MAEPIIEDLRAQEFNALLVGSVPKKMASDTSDIDIWILENEDVKIENIRKYLKNLNCEETGIIYKNNFKVIKFNGNNLIKNNVKLEINIHCDISENLNKYKTSYFNDELKDIYYCVNKVFKYEEPKKKKVVNCSDYMDFPFSGLFDIKKKK